MLSLMVVLIGAVLTVGVARVGRQMIEAHRAQAVADVAALAGASGGSTVVVQVAAANHATVLEVDERTDGSVDVTVGISAAVASAAAAPG